MLLSVNEFESALSYRTPDASSSAQNPLSLLPRAELELGAKNSLALVELTDELP